MLARLEKLISELDGLVDDIEEQDPELGLLASEVWETLRDVAGRLKDAAAADWPTTGETQSKALGDLCVWGEGIKTNALPSRLPPSKKEVIPIWP